MIIFKKHRFIGEIRVRKHIISDQTGLTGYTLN